MSMLILKKKNSRDLDEAAQYEPPYLDLHCLLYSLWRGLVDNKLVQAPPPSPPHPLSNFIAGRPKAALLFWFFGYFRCGVSLFIVIRVIYKYRNR